MKKRIDDEEDDEVNSEVPNWEPALENLEDNEDAGDLAPDMNLIMEEEDEDEAEEPASSSENAPKLVGKHSLGYDSIFKGKKTASEEDESTYNEGFKFDPSTIYYQESVESLENYRMMDLKTKVHSIILIYTDINLDNNRRKPSRADFNRYFKTIIEKLNGDGFSMSEMFVTLAYYFSENLFNMFKLLDKKYGEMIITELKNYKNLDFLDSQEFF